MTHHACATSPPQSTMHSQASHQSCKYPCTPPSPMPLATHTSSFSATTFHGSCFLVLSSFTATSIYNSSNLCVSVCLSVCLYVCLRPLFLDNHWYDLIEPCQEYCWGPEYVPFQGLILIGQAVPKLRPFICQPMTGHGAMTSRMTSQCFLFFIFF